MEFLTWPLAFTVVSSVAVICVSIIKIIQVRKDKADTISPMECERRCNTSKTQLAIQGSLLKQAMEDQRRLEDHMDKLNDNLIRILQEGQDH